MSTRSTKFALFSVAAALTAAPALSLADQTKPAGKSTPAAKSAPAVEPKAPKPEKDVDYSYGDSACSSGESWRFSPTVYSEWRDRFRSTLSGGIPPVKGFAQALALRKLNYSDETKILAEYWISRSLYAGNLAHISYSGFSHIAGRDLTEESTGVQFAALECITRLHQRYPTFELPGKVSERIDAYLSAAKSAKQKRVVWEYATHLAKSQFAKGRSTGEINATIKLLKGSGAYETFARLMLASRKGDHSAAIREGERFLANKSLPDSLERYMDQVHLMTARAYYSTERFDQAELHLKQVRKASNELAKSLSELAWAYLQSEKYSEAIGTAVNLQQGGLRQTFAPEAPMVMAMALNEICQYPESVRAVSTFRKFYESSYRWLAQWGKEKPALYPLAVDYVKKAQARKKTKEKSLVPDKVASEWVRSPIFISHQDEINLIFDERDATERLARSGSTEQKRSAQEIKALVAELKPKIRAERKRLKPGEFLPKSLRLRLAQLRRAINDYKRFRKAAPVWQVVLSNYKKNIVPTEKKLIASINSDLADRSGRMAVMLEEIAENNQLIEVEIYNGASQDIIWQNAHPDYKKLAEKMKEDSQKAHAKVLDWGRVPASDDDGGEIWEDELGSFKANLYDNCSSKDKYLALKRLKRAF